MDVDDTCSSSHPPRPPVVLREDTVVERAASFLRAMADPARLRLLERLALHGEQCVSELAEASGDGMSTVSQRLRLLRSERLVSRRREGKHIHYALHDDHVRALIEAALEHAEEHG